MEKEKEWRGCQWEAATRVLPSSSAGKVGSCRRELAASGEGEAGRSSGGRVCAVKFNMQEGRPRDKRDTSPLKGNIIYSVQPGGP